MKKLLKVLLVIILSLSVVYAQDRTAENNYGVNKKWKITNKNMPNVLRTHLVDASQKIYDYSNILTDEEEAELKRMSNEFLELTGMEFIILTDSLPYTRDSENEDYMADFYDYNDFGINEEHYSGVLFFRNTYAADPFFNILTFGEAQLYFDYNRCERTLDYIYDDIHEGNYLEGMTKMIRYLRSYYYMGKSLSDYYVDDMGYIHKTFKVPYVGAAVVGAIVTLITMLILVKKNKMIKKATNARDYYKSDEINYRFKLDKFLTQTSYSYTVSSSSSSGGGGGFSSSSGSSGGGHGGGGGRHG